MNKARAVLAVLGLVCGLCGTHQVAAAPEATGVAEGGPAAASAGSAASDPHDEKVFWIDPKLLNQLEADGLGAALRIAYPKLNPGIPLHGTQPQTLLRGVAPYRGAVLSYENHTVTGVDVLALGVTLSHEDEESFDWAPEIVILENHAGTLAVRSRTSPVVLRLSNRTLREDTGSAFTLTALPLSPQGAALSATLRDSSGGEETGRVFAMTYVYVLQGTGLRTVFKTTAYDAGSAISGGAEGQKPAYYEDTTTLAAADTARDGVSDLIVKTRRDSGSKDAARKSTSRQWTVHWSKAAGRFR